MGKEKSRINLVVIGNIDSGKSTATGHLIYKCGAIDKTAFENFDLTGEKERGVAANLSRWKFETQNHQVTIMDAPGHKDFIKNVLTGINGHAHSAILFVSAQEGEFEHGISADGQTYTHAVLASTLGVKHLIVAVNKMDTVGFSQERYDAIVRKVSSLTTEAGYPRSSVVFVPISGKQGDNMVEPSSNLSWYNEWSKEDFSGITLLEAIDQSTPTECLDKLPLRIPLQDVYKIDGMGTVPVGRIESGTIRSGQKVTFAPVNMKAVVTSVEMNHQLLEKGVAGDSIGLSVKDIHVRDVRRGYVCSDPENDPARRTISFIAQIIVIHHPSNITIGYSPTVDCHTAHVSCRFAELLNKIDQCTGKIIEINPKSLQKGDSATVKLVPLNPLCVEAFVDYPSMGRFAVRDLNQTIAIGVIKSVEKADVNEIPPKSVTPTEQ